MVILRLRLLLMCCSKEEFSVIILGLDGAGKTVCICAVSYSSSVAHTEVEDTVGENQDTVQ